LAARVANSLRRKELNDFSIPENGAETSPYFS
jgi:hypothetical protein